MTELHQKKTNNDINPINPNNLTCVHFNERKNKEYIWKLLVEQEVIPDMLTTDMIKTISNLIEKTISSIIEETVDKRNIELLLLNKILITRLLDLIPQIQYNENKNGSGVYTREDITKTRQDKFVSDLAMKQDEYKEFVKKLPEAIDFSDKPTSVYNNSNNVIIDEDGGDGMAKNGDIDKLLEEHIRLRDMEVNTIFSTPSGNTSKPMVNKPMVNVNKPMVNKYIKIGEEIVGNLPDDVLECINTSYTNQLQSIIKPDNYNSNSNKRIKNVNFDLNPRSNDISVNEVNENMNITQIMYRIMKQQEQIIDILNKR